MKKLFLMLCSLAALLLTACETYNNDRSLTSLTNHMMKETGGVFLCSMEPGVVHAESGSSIVLDDKQVAFYKYDINKVKMKKWPPYVKKNGHIYYFGIKKAAMVNGSFIMVDYDQLPEESQKRTVEAFKKFK